MESALIYVAQALTCAAQAAELARRAEAGAAVWPELRGTLVSLTRNLESAQADLQLALRPRDGPTS